MCKAFNQNSKKRDFSSNSTYEEGSTKLMERSIDIGNVSDNPEDVFAEGLKSLDLHKAVGFISKKFNEHEKERRERQVIKNTREDVTIATNEVEKLSIVVKRQEQYSRPNCLLLHGILSEILKIQMKFLSKH